MFKGREFEMKFLSLLVLLLLIPVAVRSLNPSLSDDVLGLIVFKADIQDSHGKLSSWNEDDDTPCLWVGVNCDPRSNRVSQLNLDGFGLSGRLGKGLLQLQFLRKLSLSRNNLTGNLIPGLTQLENLRVIDLSENSLSGAIPVGFFQQCSSLGSISLAKNKFSGQIPDSFSACSTLAALNFSSNEFSGMVPSGIWSLNGLRSLDLSNNQLEGSIPQGIGAMNNLREIILTGNKLTGNIPDSIGDCLLLRTIDVSHNLLVSKLPSTMQKLTLVTHLHLQKNSLEGEVPYWIGEMRSLQTLDLSYNTFAGQLPSSIGNLQSLKVLTLSMNALTGDFPDSLSKCVNLVAMDLSHNLLTGSLPVWIFKLGLEEIILAGNNLNGSINNSFSPSTDLQVLDLSNNGLSGEIPSLAGFPNLQVLNLSKNSLEGPIPSSVGDLKALNILDLSLNQLNGSIPMEIGAATSLNKIKLDKNSLTGNLPSAIGNCSSLHTLILARNSITGPIPASMAEIPYLQYVDLSFNKLNGNLPKQLANLIHIISFNISHNQLQGELPSGGFFNTISPSSVSNNPALCGAAVNRNCPTVLPKPLVLNPNSSDADPATPIIETMMNRKKTMLSISALVAIGAASVIVIGVITITVLNLRVQSSITRSAAALTFSGDDFSHSQTSNANSGKLVMFSGEPDFSTGAHALLNKDCELGRGGFGAVYRTILRDGRSVAIKKLTVSSLVKSKEDFEREVKKLGKLQHPNLVELEGYYWTPSLQLLIYDFISGGSLHKHLHDSSGNFLSWNQRFNLIIGSAKGLSYLHKMNIIHYNIKSSNILIDESGEAKLADYGLARLLPMLDRYILSSKIQSALGYMAPEFACQTVKITEKCDVYGFGVLVLEMVTGRRPVEYMEDDVVVLCDVVRGGLEEGKVEECIDEKLKGEFAIEEAIPLMKLGLICTSQVPSNRPDMEEVINILELIRSPSETGLDRDELV